MTEYVKISKERLIELLQYENLVENWHDGYNVCEKCGCLNPSGYICANCEHDNSDEVDPDELVEIDWLEYEDVDPDYLEMFKSLPNLNFNKQRTTEDFYNPTLYPWESRWIVSWVSDEGDSLIEFVGTTPEEAINKATEYIRDEKI